MLNYKDFKDVSQYDLYSDRKKGTCSNTIYTFDTETTSLYKYADRWNIFDYSVPLEEYNGVEKRGLLYLWQFSVNEEVYYGRTLSEFLTILLKISDRNIRKFIYIFNYSFEFQWLLNILDDYECEVLATSPHKVISAYYPTLNIEFRCLYRLCNMSLEKSADTYNKKYKKLVGTIDYNILRTPITKLSNTILQYAEYDCLTCFEIIKKFKSEYGSIAQIPLTQTGELRREFKEKTGYYYFKDNVWKYIEDGYIRQVLMTAFIGGYTHANYIKVGRIINNVYSADISSSYPFRLLAYKFVMKYFSIEKREHEKYNNERYGHIYLCSMTIKSKGSLTYISSSKVINLTQSTDYTERASNLVYDNGKLFKGDNIEMIILDTDLHIIKNLYHINDFKIIKEWVGLKKRIDKRVIIYLLELFQAKSRYKGIDDELYMKSKQRFNSVYGSAVYNLAKNNTEFTNGEWIVNDITNETVNKALRDSYGSYTALMPYAVGVQTTAYARESILDIIQRIGMKDFIYSDTDSAKFNNFTKHYKLLHNFNMQMLKMIDDTSKDLSLKRTDFIAVTPTGDIAILGFLDFFDGHYERFITLGSKKYAVEKNGKIELTVAGLPKKNKKGEKNTLEKLENFNDDLVCGYDYGKNTLSYIDNISRETMKVIDDNGIEYVDNSRYSVVLTPTTYNLKQSHIDKYECEVWQYY